METLQVIEPIRMRRSIRKYNQEVVVTEEQIKLLLEAAMLAPSACNSRPWEFVVVKSRSKLDQLASVHPYAKMLNSATLAIIVCALPGVQDDIAQDYFPQDCGAATENILIQATAMNLGSCWCGVYPKEDRIEEVREVLGDVNRQDLLPFNIIAIGSPKQSPEARGYYEESKVTYI